MKKTLVRANCFETNSSSSHSVSVEENDFLLDTIHPDPDGVIRIELGEFGWDWFKYNTAEIKAAYAWQVFENSPGKQDQVKEIIKKQSGASDVVFIGEGYVDHQSRDVLDGFDSEAIRNFIFNRNSWLFGGNDNE